ncbi:(2Fe-2S)-binding protein [Spirosoma oryzicola]|uniref:(2Fe-2S)-binding protein n=1 Tax=Spirosoma oryzicola TaxID=2898794 RepID=UPI001E477818|nr:(2Fe-2S)-binding protein [Spirosoma oryzicola]UHG93876.1 (2Fe-2S)-binding protein [Spirosoma oryzicola]
MENRPPDSPIDNEEGHSQETRRDFLKHSSLLTAYALSPSSLVNAAEMNGLNPPQADTVSIHIDINGTSRTLHVEPRVTLLDLLREQLDLTGTKKGCDYGQCGACTVHINGIRALACLSFAVMQNGKKITTIEGLAKAEASGSAHLHPMQAAFIKHDGFQCGYCTPGQIMSAVGCIREGHANSDAEIKEYMSGNICRCGAYEGIVEAVKEVKQGGQKV